jgi:hypothetical protein
MIVSLEQGLIEEVRVNRNVVLWVHLVASGPEGGKK